MKEVVITTRNIREWLEFDKTIAEKIIEKNRYINTDYAWYDDTINDFIEEMEKRGIDIEYKNVKFSGFYCQGDGASFTCNLSSNYIDNWITANKDEFPKLFKMVGKEFIYGKLEKNSYATHYCHDKTVDLFLYVNNEDEYSEEFNEEMEKLERLMETNLRSYMVELYNRLEKEYDYLTSDESIIETLEATEYEFDENGVIR